MQHHQSRQQPSRPVAGDCKKQFLRDSAFPGMCIDVERHHGKIGLAISRYPPK